MMIYRRGAEHYADGDLEPARYMMNHKDVVPGLSDGGAHVGTICDGSFPTTLLTYWTRDRTRGPQLPLAQVIRMQARDTARAVGLYDRGVLARGYRADLNVIDHENLRLFAPEVAYDLPAGGKRLLQRASGYVAAVVAGPGDLSQQRGHRGVAGPTAARRAAAPMAAARGIANQPSRSSVFELAPLEIIGHRAQQVEQAAADLAARNDREQARELGRPSAVIRNECTVCSSPVRRTGRRRWLDRRARRRSRKSAPAAPRRFRRASKR